MVESLPKKKKVLYVRTLKEVPDLREFVNLVGISQHIIMVKTP